MSGENRPRTSGGAGATPPSGMQLPVARRTLLRSGLGGAGLLATGALLGACSSTNDTTADGIVAGPQENLTALFPRDITYVAAGYPSRLVYTITDAEGVPAMEIDGPLTFSVEFSGEAVGDPIEVVPHGDGVPRPYLPLPFTFPEPGIYDVRATRGDVVMSSQVIVDEPAAVPNPLVGDVLPSAGTATAAQPLDVDPICTRVPTCPFHEHDLAAVHGTGVPIVVLLASPAYCRTTACGPILDILIEEAAALPEGVIVIHSEVYKNPKSVRDLNDAQLAPLPATYEMGFEPSLFVTDAAGVLVARGDIAVDRTEMAQMLTLAR